MVVAAPASLGAVVFPSVLGDLDDATLPIHCRVAHSAEVIAHLMYGTADIGLVINQMVPAAIMAHHLCRSDVLAVCRPGHHLAGQRAVNVDDLIETHIAIYRWSAEAEGLAETFDHPMRRPDRPVQLLGLPAAALQLSVDRDHVAIVPGACCLGYDVDPMASDTRATA